MAACTRCGAQNPDGNLYCQACGTPLAAAAPVAASSAPGGQPSWLPSPAAAPPQYSAPTYPAPPQAQSPYYVPSAPAPAVRRMPWTMLVGPILIVTLVLVAGGVLWGLLHGQSDASSGAGVTPSAAPETPPPGANVAENTGLWLIVPPGWTVTSKDGVSISLTDAANDGDVTAASSPSSPDRTAQQDMDAVNQALRSKYPDTQECSGHPVVASTFNGVQGLYWTLCLTLTSGGQGVPAVATMFAGANSDGSVVYLVTAITAQGNLANFTNEAKPVLQSIHWKL